MLLNTQHNILAPDLTTAQFEARSYSFTVPVYALSPDDYHAAEFAIAPMDTTPTSAALLAAPCAPPIPGIYTMTDAERYAALAKLYTLWANRTGDEYHRQWANSFEVLASIPASSV